MPKNEGVLIRKDNAAALGEVAREFGGIPKSEVGERVERGNAPRKPDHNLISVYNNSAVVLVPSNIVQIYKTGSVQDRSPIMTRELGNVAWHASTPNGVNEGTYAVMLTQATIEGIGKALVAGVVKVRLDDTNEGLFANPQYNNLTSMATEPVGMFKVLYVDTAGDSDTWGFIQLAVPMDEEFDAEITGNTSLGGNQWTYSFKQIEKLTADYGNWTDVSGGWIGAAALNRIEDINAATGVQGNGVDAANLDPAGTGSDTFFIKECPTGTPVRMKRIRFADGTSEFWFSYSNGVDGGCS